MPVTSSWLLHHLELDSSSGQWNYIFCWGFCQYFSENFIHKAVWHSNFRK